MKLEYKHSREEWRAAALAIRGTIAGATRLAFQDLAAQVQRQGRANIAAAGMAPRFATGFRTYVFPKRIVPGATTDLTMRGQHRRNYANIFERGGRIVGKPLLWIPLPTAPKRINGKPTTAGAYFRSVGPLHLIARPGRAPLLAGYVIRPAGQKTAGRRRVSVAQLRAGQRNIRRRQARAAFGGRLGGRQAPSVSVPLFVGLNAVRMTARLNISSVYDRARRDLPAIYQKRLREVTR